MMSVARGLTKFNRKEIKFLFENAKRHSYCSAFVLLRAQQQKSNVGRVLVVSPKKIGNAPMRNLLKRRIKNIFFTEKLYTKGFDWVLIARKKSTNLSFAELQEKLLAFFYVE
jgi:ribonuclease P protein component